MSICKTGHNKIGLWGWSELMLVKFLTCAWQLFTLMVSSAQKGFPCGSAGKESACNMGDLGSVPGLGRSPEKGTVKPKKVFWELFMELC